MNTEFVIGEVVQLQSGGCEMTVTDIRSDGLLTVAWIDLQRELQITSAPYLCFFSVRPS